MAVRECKCHMAPSTAPTSRSERSPHEMTCRAGHLSGCRRLHTSAHVIPTCFSLSGWHQRLTRKPNPEHDRKTGKSLWSHPSAARHETTHAPWSWMKYPLASSAGLSRELRRQMGVGPLQYHLIYHNGCRHLRWCFDQTMKKCSEKGEVQRTCRNLDPNHSCSMLQYIVAKKGLLANTHRKGQHIATCSNKGLPWLKWAGNDI